MLKQYLCLTKNEAVVLYLRCLTPPEDRPALAEIAKKLKLSRERIRQIENKAKIKLRALTKGNSRYLVFIDNWDFHRKPRIGKIY